MALKKEKKSEEIDYKIEVTRAKKVKDDYAFDMKVNGVQLYGCWIKTSKKGDTFTSFAAYKGSDGKYYSHYYFEITDKLQEEIEDQIEKLLEK